jgi:hypothetical protein
MLINVMNLNNTIPLFFKEELGEILQSIIKNTPVSPFTKGGFGRNNCHWEKI